MSNRVKMYVHDYDRFAEQRGKNLSTVPESERTQAESSYFTYKMQDKKWYVNRFLMPWVPAEWAAQHAEPASQPAPDAAVTPAPPAEATPTPAPLLLEPVG